jgi:hypothetical protein
MLKMQSADPRSERIHGQIAGAHTHSAPAPAAAAAPAARVERAPHVARPADDDHPRPYTL